MVISSATALVVANAKPPAKVQIAAPAASSEEIDDPKHALNIRCTPLGKNSRTAVPMDMASALLQTPGSQEMLAVKPSTPQRGECIITVYP